MRKNLILTSSLGLLGVLSSANAAVTASSGAGNAERLTEYAANVAIPEAAAASDVDWGSSIDLGVSYATGNTDNLFITASLNVNREIDRDTHLFNLTFAFGESNSETTANEILASYAWKRLITDRTYAGLRADIRQDELADIDYRASLTGLYGVHLIKGAQESLSIEGGFGYTFEQQGVGRDDFVNIYFGENYEKWINSETRLYQSFAFTAPLEDLGDYSLVGELGIETTLTEAMSLKVYVQDRYEAEPAAGFENNDLKIITGISYKF